VIQRHYNILMLLFHCYVCF